MGLEPTTFHTTHTLHTTPPTAYNPQHSLLTHQPQLPLLTRHTSHCLHSTTIQAFRLNLCQATHYDLVPGPFGTPHIDSLGVVSRGRSWSFWEQRDYHLVSSLGTRNSEVGHTGTYSVALFETQDERKSAHLQEIL